MEQIQERFTRMAIVNENVLCEIALDVSEKTFIQILQKLK